MMQNGFRGFVLLIACCSVVSAQEDMLRRTVVKVFCTSNQLDLSSPWRRRPGAEASGSGVWLGGRRILTNEHLVDFATQISVQPYNSIERIPAEVVFVSPEMDLAIIELDSDLPFNDLVVPTIAGKLPNLQSTVRVYGSPHDGRSLPVAEGIVSRIEYVPYSHGEYGLRVQLAATINPGSSGGPAYVDDEMIGIAFQKRSPRNNVSYLIPSEEILRFLDNAQNENNASKPVLPIVHQKLVSRDLRSELGLDNRTTGVVVRALTNVPENYPIEIGDVLTRIGGHDIDNSGRSRLGDDLLVGFEYYIDRVASNGKVSLDVYRGGKEQTIHAAVDVPRKLLISPLRGEYPSYFIYGPLVLMPAPADYLSVFESMMASPDQRRRMSGLSGFAMLSRRSSPLLLRRYAHRQFADEELVLVVNWLSHESRAGYESPVLRVVNQVNGVTIRSLKHLVETLCGIEDAYVKFEFADKQAEMIVFDREFIEAQTESILRINGIPSRASLDLLDVWNKGK